MFEIVDVQLKAQANRIGYVAVKYYDLLIQCDICVYKQEKLWIRFPERWIGKVKKRFVCWVNQEKSQEYQEKILCKVFDLTGLDMEKALKMKLDWYNEKKNADKNKENTYFTGKR